MIREGLYRALGQAFTAAGVRWRDCYHEDRGDGVLVLVPPEVPKSVVATVIPRQLAAALGEHNRVQDREARIRLRLSVHAGEVHRDEYGVVGSALNVAFRLLEAESLKRALACSRGVLAVIVSQWLFEEVVRHDPMNAAARYRREYVSVKETSQFAWICLPDDPYPPQEDVTPPSLPVVSVPRQLPVIIPCFAGRAIQLSVYVNARGFDATGSSATPTEAIRGFLIAFDVPEERNRVSLEHPNRSEPQPGRVEGISGVGQCPRCRPDPSAATRLSGELEPREGDGAG